MRKTGSPFTLLAVKTPLVMVIAVLTLVACESSYMSHDDRVKMAIGKIDYADGISEQEAGTIADAYLLLHGRYKDRAMFARIADSGGEWVGKVYAAKALASPVDADLPPIRIDKKSGKIIWQFGPTVARIDAKALANAEPSVAPYKAEKSD